MTQIMELPKQIIWIGIKQKYLRLQNQAILIQTLLLEFEFRKSIKLRITQIILRHLSRSKREKDKFEIQSLREIKMLKMQQLKRMIDSAEQDSFRQNTSVELVNNNLMRTTPKTKASSVKNSKPPTQPSFKQSMKQISTQVQKIKRKPIDQLEEQKRKVLRALYERKCANLMVKINEEKWMEFLTSFVQANPDTEHSLQLQLFNLTGCEKQINGLLEIASSTTSLNVSKTLINPSLINVLSIRKLYLNNCNLGNSEINLLLDKLMETKVIQVLSLSSQQVNNKNHLTQYQKLYQFIEQASNLRQLHLGYCSIRKDNKIFQYLKHSSIRVIDLSCNQKVIGMSCNIQELNLQSNGIQNPSLLYNLECKSRNELRALNIARNPIHHYDLKVFLKPNYLSKLSHLKMDYIQIHEECPSLQEFISYSNSLVSLSLVACQLSEQSWMNVIFGLKNNYSISQLNLSHNEVPSEDIAKCLGQVFLTSRIRKINMSSCSIRDSYGPLMFANLHNQKYLECLDLSFNKLNSVSASFLSQILKGNYSIKYLNVDENAVGYLLTKQLKQYVKRNSFFEAKNLQKEHSALSGVRQEEILKLEELQHVQKLLQEAKSNRMQIEAQVYELKSKQINEQIHQIRLDIKKIQSEQNQLVKQIQDIYASLYNPLSFSLPCIRSQD